MINISIESKPRFGVSVCFCEIKGRRYKLPFTGDQIQSVGQGQAHEIWSNLNLINFLRFDLNHQQLMAREKGRNKRILPSMANFESNLGLLDCMTFGFNHQDNSQSEKEMWKNINIHGRSNTIYDTGLSSWHLIELGFAQFYDFLFIPPSKQLEREKWCSYFNVHGKPETQKERHRWTWWFWYIITIPLNMEVYIPDINENKKK